MTCFSRLIACFLCSVGICRSAACASASEPTSRVERWPCAPTCCRVSRLNGLFSRDTPLKTCSAFRYDTIHVIASSVTAWFWYTVKYWLLSSNYHKYELVSRLIKPNRVHVLIKAKQVNVNHVFDADVTIFTRCKLVFLVNLTVMLCCSWKAVFPTPWPDVPSCSIKTSMWILWT